MTSKTRKSFAGQPAFQRLKQMLHRDEGIRDVTWGHEVGTLVNNLCPRGKRAYGQGNIQRLAEELDQGSSLANKLWNARKLAVALSRSQLVKLARAAKKADFRLTASHVLAIVTVRDEEHRENLADACVQQRWTVKRLRREIHRVQGKKSGGGAPVVELASQREALDDVFERTKSWLARYDQAWFGNVEARLAGDIELDMQDEATANYIREIEDLLLDLKRAAAAARGHLRQQRLGTASE